MKISGPEPLHTPLSQALTISWVPERTRAAKECSRNANFSKASHSLVRTLIRFGNRRTDPNEMTENEGNLIVQKSEYYENQN